MASTQESVSALENELGYQFKNPALLTQALTHKSAGRVNYERMELLGDAILSFAAADLLYHEFPDLPEGNMSRIRAGMVKEETLVKVAKRIGLPQHIRYELSEHMTALMPSIIADSLEAVFAAIRLDQEADGLQNAVKVVRRQLIIMLNNKEADIRKDPKTKLQEYLQGRRLQLPQYSLENANGHGERRYQASCSIPELKIRTIGYGPSRRHAEFDAADRAIHQATQ